MICCTHVYILRILFQFGEALQSLPSTESIGVEDLPEENYFSSIVCVCVCVKLCTPALWVMIQFVGKCVQDPLEASVEKQKNYPPTPCFEAKLGDQTIESGDEDVEDPRKQDCFFLLLGGGTGTHI